MSERDRVIEEARQFWIYESSRIGPDWDTAEIMYEFSNRENTRLITLLTDIRFALGDDGKRMQDEFVEYCKGIGAELDRLRGLELFVNGLFMAGWHDPVDCYLNEAEDDGFVITASGDNLLAFGNTPAQAIYAYLDKQADNGGSDTGI
jgi:hypothetical protein